MGDHVYSHSPVPSVASLEDSTQAGFTLSDISSLKSASSDSEQSLDRLSINLNLNETEKKLRHVRFLIDEMRDTELTYINALTDVTEGYISRLRRDKSSGFTPDVIKEAFVNIEEILQFHEKLHSQLLNCDNSHQLVSQLFLDKIDILTTLYIKFCSAFPKSLDKLEMLHNNEPSKSALEQCQRELGHTFPVEEYLHRAVQRFLKYPLLFKDMVKKLVSLDGHSVAKEALDKLLITAMKINSVKRVQELQATELVGWKGGDMLDMGDLLLEDSFKVLGAKDPRYLFLFQKSMLLTKKKESDCSFAFKNEILMDNITLKEQVDNDFLKWTIMVGKSSESYTLQARDEEQKERWTREIKRCIVYSTPGLTQEQKELLLQKLPSLKNNCEHIDRLWKRVHKKNKKVKRTESVRILHKPDYDEFDNSSEISKAYEDSPNNKNDLTVFSEHLVPSDTNLSNRPILPENESTRNEEETVSSLTTEEQDDIEEEVSVLPDIIDFSADSDTADHLAEDECDGAELLSERDLTYKSEVTAITDLVDSDIDNIRSEANDPPVELDTGADSLLGFFNGCIINSRYYPATLLLLIYCMACLIYFTPWYITSPISILIAAIIYLRSKHSTTESEKKLC